MQLGNYRIRNGYARWDCYAGQAAAVRKSRLANLHNALGNDHIPVGAAVMDQNSALNDKLQIVFHNIFLLKINFIHEQDRFYLYIKFFHRIQTQTPQPPAGIDAAAVNSNHCIALENPVWLSQLPNLLVE